ncbi:MAG: transcriptional regulator [Halobaculum sp.]
MVGFLRLQAGEEVKPRGSRASELEDESGVDPLADAFIDHPEVTVQSTTCVAAADHMWRVDTLFGPEDALNRIETRFLDKSQCNECHGHGCDTERRYEMLERAPTHRIAYTHRREIRGCHSIPYVAVEHVGSGVLFETDRTGDTYEWTVLMPDDEGVGGLYDAIGAKLREGVGLDLQHVTGHQGWRSGALAAPDSHTNNGRPFGRPWRTATTRRHESVRSRN